MSLKVRKYTDKDYEAMRLIWNEVVEDGIAFPQEECLDIDLAKEFFDSQTTCGVAEDDYGNVVGLYILHPNNIGRCGHISNASYCVKSEKRGEHIGEALVRDSIKKASEYGFKILQFNAVVKTNYSARHLYEKIGFKSLGIIPKGFKMKDGHYEDICPYYIEV